MTREEVIAALADYMTSLGIAWHGMDKESIAKSVLDWLDSIGYTAQFLDEADGNGYGTGESLLEMINKAKEDTASNLLTKGGDNTKGRDQ